MLSQNIMDLHIIILCHITVEYVDIKSFKVSQKFIHDLDSIEHCNPDALWTYQQAHLSSQHKGKLPRHRTVCKFVINLCFNKPSQINRQKTEANVTPGDEKDLSEPLKLQAYDVLIILSSLQSFKNCFFLEYATRLKHVTVATVHFCKTWIVNFTALFWWHIHKKCYKHCHFYFPIEDVGLLMPVDLFLQNDIVLLLVFKMIAHAKINILSSLTHLHLIQIWLSFLFWAENKIFK